MKEVLKLGSLGALTRELQTALNALGGNLLVDGVFGDNTFDAVCDFQGAKKLEQDGIVGPKTWLAIEQGLTHLRHDEERRVRDRLRFAGEKAVERALAMWKLDIYDPKTTDDTLEAVRSKQYIDDMIRSGLGWTWEQPYAGDGDFQWCGAFAAACWIDVKPELRKLYFSSTFRLDRYASYRPAFGEKNEGSGRLCAQLDMSSTAATLPFEPRAGDILLVGTKGYGSHICLVESFDPETGLFNTIEGNGNGKGPNGELQHGVIRRRQRLGVSFYCARRLIRPSVDDLI